MKKPPRILLVVNADWVFLSHRLSLAKALQKLGAEVVVAGGETGQSSRIAQEGIRFFPLPITRKGINPFVEIRALLSMVNLYRHLNPDLVHHFTIKPVLYGNLAARLIGKIPVINTVSGLGYVFSKNKKARLIRRWVIPLYRMALRHTPSQTIFQNKEDREKFINLGISSEDRSVVIRGSGVNGRLFLPTPEPPGDPIVMLPCRMLWDKGVQEFIEAARSLRSRQPRTRFALVGSPDEGNPRTLSVEQLKTWQQEDGIEWWGHREDMSKVISQASIVVLPTASEGVPKVLLEAAASARPIVTTDVPGCREIVRHQVNGLLVPPHDAAALARAIQNLLEDPEQRRKFGEAGRKIAMAEFSEEIVIQKTFDIYRWFLDIDNISSPETEGDTNWRISHNA